MSKKELSFESATTKKSTHLLRLWVNRSEAVSMANIILNNLHDPDTKEIGLSLFVTECEDD